MPKDVSILIGTIGAGLWASPDGGRSWGRAGGIWGDMKVFGLKVDPSDPAVVYAGTDEGIFRSNDRGKSFERLDSLLNDRHVWNIAVSPSDPSVIFAGTSPSALFRSTDAGASWEQLTVDMAEECPQRASAARYRPRSRPQQQQRCLGGRRSGRRAAESGRRRDLDAHQRGNQ